MPRSTLFKEVPEDGFFLVENGMSDLTLCRKRGSSAVVYTSIGDESEVSVNFDMNVNEGRSFRPYEQVYLLTLDQK